MTPLAGSTRALLGCAAAYHFRHPLVTTCAPSALTAAGIGRVAFIRHGNTAPSPNGVDFERQLTNVGREQSRAAGASYGADRLQPFHQLALCSPAPRCVETANIFLDAALKNSSSDSIARTAPELDLVAGLYDGTMQPEGSRLFQLIGYAALRDYLENPNEEDRNAALDVLGSYAKVALEGIFNSGGRGTTDKGEVVGAAGNYSRKTTTLLFFAHAIYLPSAALGLAEFVGCSQSGIDLVLSTNTKEAEGYVVDLLEKEISLLVRPEETN